MNSPNSPEETPEESNAQGIRRLVRGLQLAKGFALYFVICNDCPFALKQMELAEAALPPNYVLRVSITQPIESLREYLLERIHQEEHPPRALFLYGLESWIAKDKVVETDMILRINAIRNSFAATLPYCLVFWLPEYLYLAMLRAAPDFCSIRSGIYQLTPPASQAKEIPTTQSLTSGNYTELMGIPLEERKERLQDLTALLAEYQSIEEDSRDLLAEARILQRSGDLYYGFGQYEEAEPLYLRALSIREKQLGAEHPDTANSLNNLALLYRVQGKYAEAEPLYQKAIIIAKKALGKQHPDTQLYLNNYKALWWKQGNPQGAEAFLKAWEEE